MPDAPTSPPAQPGGAGSATPARTRRRRWPAVLLVLLVLVVGGATAGLAWLNALLSRPFRAYSDTERFVDIPSGTSVSAMGQRLAAAGVVPDAWTFRLAVWRRHAGKALKAGEYRFDRPLSPLAVAEKLARGDVYLRKITFPEGLTIADMAGIFESQGLGTAASFRDAAGDAAVIADLDPAARDLEGYLFPDTYAAPRSGTAHDLVDQMVKRFKRVYSDAEAHANDASRARPGPSSSAAAETSPDASHSPGAAAPQEGAARDVVEASANSATPRSPNVREIVTLASLVEKETASASERPTVAGVYRNRLRIGMGLQCDPTVIYALARAGRYTGNLTRADLQFDSPYNTYRYAGLPPGPIASPGRASLEAALRPASVPFLYFVSRNDGTHVFATTLDEHSRNVREFQVQYFRNRK